MTDLYCSKCKEIHFTSRGKGASITIIMEIIKKHIKCNKCGSSLVIEGCSICGYKQEDPDHFQQHCCTQVLKQRIIDLREGLIWSTQMTDQEDIKRYINNILAYDDK